MSYAPHSISRRLLGFLEFSLIFENTSGLLIKLPIHAQTFRIGGADQYPMVTIRKYLIGGKEIEKEVPLIPGSSIKGRMRGLLELALGKKLYTADKDKKIWQHVRSLKAMSEDVKEFFKDIKNRCEIDDLFGWAAANLSQIVEALRLLKESPDKAFEYFKELAPTRLLVDDFTPADDFISRNHGEFESIADFIEEKSENRIDRVTAAADPRQIARIRPGIEFGGKLKMLVFDIDRNHVKKYLSTLALGLKLLEETYIGGSGSRGYGRIKFKKIVVNLKKIVISNGNVQLESKELYSLSSVDDLINKVDALAKTVVNELFEP